MKLLQLEIGAHPPQAAVVALTLRAEAGQQSKVQLGLFAPQMPEPSRLDVTLARLRALVGEERVGSPVLEDTHRAGGFHMEGFRAGDDRSRERSMRARARADGVAACAASESGAGSSVAGAMTAGSSPYGRAIPGPKSGSAAPEDHTQAGFFRDGENSYEIAAAYGPWRTSGCWWAVDAWDTEEWDVLATRTTVRSVACLLTCDRRAECVAAGGVLRLTAASVLPNTRSPGTPVCHPNDAVSGRGWHSWISRIAAAGPSTRGQAAIDRRISDDKRIH